MVGDAYRRDVGVPEDELGTGAECIVDPVGRGPRIWFHLVPERKAAKNRMHIDISVKRRPRGSDRDAQAARRRGGELSARSRCAARPCPRDRTV